MDQTEEKNRQDNNQGKDTNKSPAALGEEKTLEFWRDNKIFEKTLEKPAPQGEFIFYEGPPTANALPAIHHLEARAFKDVIPRYKTMRGFHVARKAGWDTHGLPVELQVEKKLGLKSKKEIESYGIEKFNRECKESVWQNIDAWEAFTDRIAFWLDRDNPYITYEKTYMESVWNILKTVSLKKTGQGELLYKDYKVVPWCPRCGTALSSHELAQGYEDVKDLSVTVEFRVKGRPESEPPASFLAWTTTPWTLPGNLALAVNPKVTYVEIEKKDMGDGDLVRFVLAKDRLAAVFGESEYSIVKEIKGSDLVGLEYEPLYPFLSEKFGGKNPEVFKKAFKVYPADFVTIEDGTGIVHTAVMYGQDDFELGTKAGLPKFHLVNTDGTFIENTGFLSGRFVRDEETAVEIIKDLAHRGLLFKKEKYTHSYPHCWRCKTPLIYYARDSWYIRMSALQRDLVRENAGINWEPAHIKEGRFGEWLREVKDWAISRERYWGTPLPIWENEEGKRIVIGSVAELKERIPKRNRFIVVRHAQSESNADNSRISFLAGAHDLLTALGERQAEETGKELKKENIDVIITSPLVRAKKTAEIIAESIGFAGEIIEDVRLSEIRLEGWEGKPWEEYLRQFKKFKDRFVRSADDKSNCENWEDLRIRVSSLMYELDSRYENKNILIVGHGGPLNLINLSSKGYSVSEISEHDHDGAFKNSEAREIDWRNLPHDEKFEIDLHRPFIDSVVLYDPEAAAVNDKKATSYKRVKEVLDVWFDSGAMPFAQYHYPFESRKTGFFGKLFGSKDELPYPADYISEAIDQTRGWFYTLLAIGILMGKGKPYKNVICLGHILDGEGKKMSKSLGNVIDPWVMMNKYGADALRLWMYSVNQPGDSKNFDERSVDEIVKKVFNLAGNIVTFYELYVEKNESTENFSETAKKSSNVLDRWIISRFNQLIQEGTESLDRYKIFESSRAIRDFIGDFSTWYLRRSRDRFKSEDANDRNSAISTTRFILRELSKYMAPFTPFFAEQVYEKVRATHDQVSVHLENWPDGGKIDEKLLGDMEIVRRVVSLALEARMKAGIKVRQPLQKITLQKFDLKGKEELLSLIRDEVNIKEIDFDEKIDASILLHVEISDNLQEEGNLRELVRYIQDLRKKSGLEPGDKVTLVISTNSAGENFVKKFKTEISKSATLSDIVLDSNISDEEITIGDMNFKLQIKK